MSAKRMMARAPRPAALAPVVLCTLLSLTTACSWFTDFKQQPKIDPWESVNDSTPPRGNPQNSVPIYGSAAPGYEYGRTPLPATIDSMSSIANPTVADSASLARGRKLFQINCAPCHNQNADGNGAVVKYGFVAINLLGDITKNRTDGYIFGMIRNGRGLMPPYNRIEESDRWHIVNYLRALQGKGTMAVIAAPVAMPGVTGTAVPGASVSAPTKPAPWYGQPKAATPAPAATAPLAPHPAAPVSPATSPDTGVRP